MLPGIEAWLGLREDSESEGTSNTTCGPQLREYFSSGSILSGRHRYCNSEIERFLVWQEVKIQQADQQIGCTYILYVVRTQ